MRTETFQLKMLLGALTAQATYAARTLPVEGDPYIHEYPADVRYWIGDLSQGWDSHPDHSDATNISDANAEDIVDGLYVDAYLNALRMPMYAALTPSDYADSYNTVYEHARKAVEGVRTEHMMIHAAPIARSDPFNN